MRGTRSKEAFELFKEGVRARSLPLTEALWRRSDNFFRQAIEKDTGLRFDEARAKRTGFPRAWSWMAYGVAQSYFEGWQSEGVIRDAIEYANLSVALDEFDYDNHWVAAYVHLLTGDTSRVEYHMSEALYLNEEDLNMSLLNEMADVLVWLGRPDDAIKLLEKGRRTTDWNRWSMAWSYYFKAAEDPSYYDRALEEAEKTYWKPGQEKYEHDIQLLIAAIHAQRAIHLEGLGRSDESWAARKSAEAAMVLFNWGRPGWTLADESRRMPFARTPEGDAARAHWLEGLERMNLLPFEASSAGQTSP